MNRYSLIRPSIICKLFCNILRWNIVCNCMTFLTLGSYKHLHLLIRQIKKLKKLYSTVVMWAEEWGSWWEYSGIMTAISAQFKAVYINLVRLQIKSVWYESAEDFWSHLHPCGGRVSVVTWWTLQQEAEIGKLQKQHIMSVKFGSKSDLIWENLKFKFLRPFNHFTLSSIIIYSIFSCLYFMNFFVFI